MGKLGAVGSLLAASIALGGVDGGEAEAKAPVYARNVEKKGLEPLPSRAKAKPAQETYARIRGMGVIDTGGRVSRVSNMPSLKMDGPLDVSSNSARAMPYLGKHVDKKVGGVHKVADGKDGNGLMEFVEKVVKFVKENAAIVLEKANAKR